MSKAKKAKESEPKPEKQTKAKKKASELKEKQAGSEKGKTDSALLQEVRDLRKKVKSAALMVQTNERLHSEISSLNETIRTLKGSNRELSSKCNRMRDILMLGNCSTLSLLIDEFIGFTTPMIQQIVLEAHIAEFDREVREKILSIIKFLSETCMEFQTILEMPTFQIETSSSKKQLKSRGDKICQSIERLNVAVDKFDESQIKLICTQYGELQKFLDSFQTGGDSQ